MNFLALFVRVTDILRALRRSQIRNGVIGRVHTARSVQETFNALHIETVRQRLQDFIAVLNIQDRLIRRDRLRPYIPSKHGFNLADTDAQHAHINRGHPTYVVCYRLENDIINLFFLALMSKLASIMRFVEDKKDIYKKRNASYQPFYKKLYVLIDCHL